MVVTPFIGHSIDTSMPAAQTYEEFGRNAVHRPFDRHQAIGSAQSMKALLERKS